MAGVQVDSGLSQNGADVQNFMDNFEIRVIDAKKVCCFFFLKTKKNNKTAHGSFIKYKRKYSLKY